MARKTPNRPRPQQAPRTPNAAPPAVARVPRAPRAPAVAETVVVDYESDLAERYHHVRRDLVRILVLGTLLFGVIFAAKFYVDQTGAQLFFQMADDVAPGGVN